MITGITVQSETDKETGKKGMVVTEHKEDLHPQIVIVDQEDLGSLASYSIPVGAHLSVKEGAKFRVVRSLLERRVRSPRPVTLPVVCHELPSSSKPVARRTPASSPRSTVSFLRSERAW